MEKVCDIVGDLLPLYLDHVCSDESRRLVEEHIGECDNCGLLLERMQAGWPEETVPPSKGRGGFKRGRVEHQQVGTGQRRGYHRHRFVQAGLSLAGHLSRFR